MIPILYDKTGNVKLGELTNCIECLVEEERNGLFEVSLIYTTNDTLFNSLEEENIIVCNANDSLLNQKFRIYMTRKLMSNRVEVFARHISFDLAYDYINNINIENQSCEYALNTIFRNSQFSTHYKGYSDIINAQDYKTSKVNCIEAIAGTEGSIIDTFGTGAEILRDNTNIHVLNKRGHDNGVSIEYAKNLTGFELEEDYTDLITRIIPFATYSDSETSEEVLVEANAVDSDLISNYSHPYINYMDFSDKFEDEEIPTTSKLIELAKKYFKENECDKPKQNFKIEFIPLSKCVGYEGIQDNISLCDTVTIKDTRFNIDTKAKVIKTVFNVLKNKYESMELGEPKTTLGDIINSSSGGESGEQGPPGPQGPPGADGSIGDFPNNLPSTPVLSANVYGFANIELNWTYENKVYYNYELYASKTKNFTPNAFDIIHQGQSSSFLFQAKPNETWYFRVCAVNTHGERTPFSSQVTVNTVKIDDLSNYVENMAISDALIGALNLGRGWFGELRGNYIDAKQLSVTDGNGKRTLDIDSFGNVSLDVTSLKISSKSVATNENVKSDIETAKGNILKEVQEVNLSVSNLSDTMNGAFKDGIIDLSESKLIEERLNELDKEKEGIDSQYSIVYSNSYLTGDSKTNLKNAKTSYDAKHENLKAYISTSIEDNKVTGDEKYNIKIKMASYSEALALVSKRLQEALDHISSKKKEEAVNTSKTYTNSQIEVLNGAISLKVDSVTYDKGISDINKYIEDTKNALNNEITDVNSNLNNLSDTMNGAFKDGIVTDTELKLISERINQLNKEKEDIDSQYSIIYSNPDLTGTVKTNLKNTKTNYDNIHTNLVNYINTIISDNKVTGDEKYTLKTKMDSYSASLAGISASLQEAIDSIGTKKKNDAIESAESKINEVKAEIKLTTDSISQRVSSTENTTMTLTTKVNDAQITADGKNKVFRDTPTVPYRIGDLWFQGSTGDILVCKSARSTGNYNRDDWGKDNKYTDDTRAEEVNVELTNTKKKVSSIETNLDGITSRVENTEKETTKINGNVVNISNRLNVAEEKITDESIIQTVSSTIDKRVVNNLIYNSSVLSNLTGFKTLGGEIRRFDSMEKIKVEENVPTTEISIPSKPPQAEIDIPTHGNIKGEEYDKVIIKPSTIIPKPVKTRMHFILTVDCGDCILIETDCGKNILIDGVDNRLISSSTYKDSTTPIMDYLDKVGITKLDYVICTHFHSDHAGALPTIMDKYCSKTSKLIYNNISDSAINSISNEVSWKTTTYKANVLNKAKSLGMETISPSNNTSFTLDSNTKFRICKSSVTSGFTSYNATSLVTVFEYKNTKVALTSDITVEVQEELKDVIGKCDIVKDVHHGYNSWISANFIKTTNPKDVIVTRNHDWGTGSKRACNSVGMWQSYEKNIYPLWYANDHILIDFIGNDYTISTSKRFYFENCWLKFEDDNDLWCYFKQGGHYAKNETLILEGKKYHFSDKGYCTNPYDPQ